MKHKSTAFERKVEHAAARILHKSIPFFEGRRQKLSAEPNRPQENSRSLRCVEVLRMATTDRNIF